MSCIRGGGVSIIRVIAVAGLMCSGLTAQALTTTGMVESVTYSVYAPDWTWEHRDINLLIVLANAGAEPVEITVNLDLAGAAGVFGHAGKTASPSPAELTRTVTLAAGETQRTAFTGLTAAAATVNHTYNLKVILQTSADRAAVAYAVRVVRGETFQGGRITAIGVPAGFGLIWCFVFLAYLRGQSAKGAWLRPSPPSSEPEAKAPWIDQKPI